MARQVPGYALGSKEVPRAPIDMSEFQKILDTVGFTGNDVEMLRRSRPILEKHLDALVGDWFDFIMDHDHLVAAFEDPDTGKADERYLDAVRARYRQWVLDTAAARYDQDWLDYQFEIGRRLHRSGKNDTDEVSALEIVPFRYLFPMSVTMLTMMRPYLEKDGASAPDIDRMLAAWDKSMMVQLTLWSYHYVGEADY